MSKFRTILPYLAGLFLVSAVVAGVATQVKYLPSGWSLAPAGERQAIGDLAAGGVASPDGKWIAFASVGQGDHKLTIVDAKTGAVASSTSVGRAWIGMAWQRSQVVLSGGTANSIHFVDIDSSGVGKLARTVVLKDLERNKGWLAGLLLDADGESGYVAVAASDEIRKVRLRDGETLMKVALPAGSSPYQLRWKDKDEMLCSLQGAEKVVEISRETLSVTKELSVGRHPNDLLVVGDRLFVACGNDDAIDVIDLYSMTREERIITRPWPNAPAGSTPHALAATKDGKSLFVANSDNNCVAVIDIEKRGRSKIEGFIPSGAYPTALAVLAGDKQLLIAAGKGLGTGPNANVDKIDPVGPAGYPYIVTLLKGLLTKVDFSDPANLVQMTETVRKVSAYKEGIVEKPIRAPKPGTNPVPSRLGDKSPIEHVLYIIKENRTYDQVFGDLKKNGKQYGNGEPKLTLFGEDVAPNHRELARQYVLLDNLYCSGEVSVDGHHWTNGAYVPDFMQRTWPQQYSGKGTPRLTSTLSATPNGRIWDQVRRAGKTYQTYYYHTLDRSSPEWNRARATNVRDFNAVDIFLKEFREFEAKKAMPNFMVMALSEDHTSGTSPGAFTPKACVASNDLGIGKLVEAISKSSYWSKFAIFIIEDDAQNGPDHVDAHRTVGLVVSPYTRRAAIDSTHYTTTSMLRTMELILGLSPMSQFDAAATPMYRSFQMKADLTPYAAKTPATDMMAKNPPRKPSPLLSSIDFSEPDQLTLEQEIALNQDIWRSVKGDVPYPGTVRRFHPGQQNDHD